MLYRLSITEQRRIQWANQISFQTPHVHETRRLDVHDFLYLLEGEWEIALGKETYRMKPHDVLLLPAGMLHSGISACAPNTRLLYFHIYPEAGDGEDTTPAMGEFVYLNNFFNAEDFPHIQALFLRLAEIKNTPTLSTAYVNTLLYEMGAVSKSGEVPSLAWQIREYLLGASPSPSNKEVAAHFYLSQKTVENLFRQTFGMPMHQYVLNHKLECAKQYLKDYPNMTLCEISQTLHFCDEHHLSRLFKKAYGISPREYKKEKKTAVRPSPDAPR